jgi:hypothetical protein
MHQREAPLISLSPKDSLEVVATPECLSLTPIDDGGRGSSRRLVPLQDALNPMKHFQ